LLSKDYAASRGEIEESTRIIDRAKARRMYTKGTAEQIKRKWISTESSEWKLEDVVSGKITWRHSWMGIRHWDQSNTKTFFKPF
jgi:hypothetical protein